MNKIETQVTLDFLLSSLGLSTVLWFGFLIFGFNFIKEFFKKLIFT